MLVLYADFEEVKQFFNYKKNKKGAEILGN